MSGDLELAPVASAMSHEVAELAQTRTLWGVKAKEKDESVDIRLIEDVARKPRMIVG
jgi:hypothetical protein